MTSSVVNRVSDELKQQVSDEFKSALSDILPDLYQLLQRYQVSSSLEIVLHTLDLDLQSFGCVDCNNRKRCGNPLPVCVNSTDTVDIVELEPEETQQFSSDLASILSTIQPRLRESAGKIENPFEVHFHIDPAANPRQPSCEFVNGTLSCSN